MDILSNEPDASGFYINQTTKVRVHKFTECGIEVTSARSKLNKLGFIPFCNLLTSIDQLRKEKELYVHYLGFNGDYLIFVEEGAFLFPDKMKPEIH